jgi:hypothetical protein
MPHCRLLLLQPVVAPAAVLCRQQQEHVSPGKEQQHQWW